MKQHLIHFIWVCIALQLSACGGDGLSNLADGGIDGTGLGVGPISGFGSIFVNDIKYETENTQVIINGQTSNTDQLKLGMYVSVEGAQDTQAKTGAAQRVDYRDTLRGQVNFISLEGQTIRILGQTVRITVDTYRYGFSDLNELKVGDTVRISSPALSTLGNNITANMIERLPNAEETSILTGTIANLDTTTQSFFIAGLQINFADIDSLTLQNGMTVEVQGEAIPRRPFRATQINEIQFNTLPENTTVNMVGNVTRFENFQDFAVQYRNVRLSANLARDVQNVLKLGVRVRISGQTDSQGIVNISEIKVYESNGLSGTPNDLLLRASGNLYAVDLNKNIVSVSGVQARLSPRTTYRDISGTKPNYNARDLRTGDYITIVGQLNQAGEFEVLRLQYEPFVRGLQRQYQGLSTNIDSLNQQLYILGKPILTIASTLYVDLSQLKDFKLPPPGVSIAPPRGNEVSAAEFFQRLEAKSQYLVNVLGDEQNDIVVAKTLILLPFTLESD